MRKVILLLIDVGLLYASLLLMLGLRYGNKFAEQYRAHLMPFGIIFALWLLVFFIANLYDPRTLRNNAYFYSQLFKAIATAAIISISVFYLVPGLGITPKLNLFIFIVVFTLLTTAGRAIFNSITETQFKRHTVVVGSSEQAKEMAKFIEDNPQLGYGLSEIVDPQNTGELENAIKTKRIDIIIISPETYRMPKIIDIFYEAIARKITFYNLSTFYENLTGRVPLGAINQVWFLENFSEGKKRTYELVKRAGDIIFGTVFGLLSLLVYPFVILAITISSPGPIFYSQVRIGQLGKKFRMHKFRTMMANAEAGTGAVWAAENDTRVSSVGRFLRKTRLDELPQLWNIVAGEMSLVGPRAERPEFHDMLKREVPFYEERYLIKPGLSGWAQINFHYGSSVQDAAEKLQYDLYYIKNRSVALDVGIVLKTARIAMQQSGK